jgi:hypothetical protein
MESLREGLKVLRMFDGWSTDLRRVMAFDYRLAHDFASAWLSPPLDDT